VGEVIPVGSLRPIWTAHKTLGGHIPEHPSCGGFMPTAETTLILASGNQRAAIRSLTSDARLDNETCSGSRLDLVMFSLQRGFAELHTDSHSLGDWKKKT
jgi:hypothetical protein